MKKFKEYLGEAFFKVSIPNMKPTFIEAGSAGEVKADLRKKFKPDHFKELEVERVTPSAMKQMYRDMAKGKEAEAEPTEEGFLDRFTKKGKEKRAKEKGERQAKEKKSEEEKAEIKKMDNLSMKGSGQHTLSPDEKSELSRLRSKYSDLVKRRAEKARSRGPR